MTENQNVINDLVGYKNLKIVQNKDWFNFSLESVLLPNFVNYSSKKQNILDLCSGNAPIPLIMSTKTSSRIIGIELQKEIFDLAKETIKINNLQNRIEIINDDVKNILNYFESDTFDIITCNPPYFKINDKTLKNENKIKAIARHEISIKFSNIAHISKILLKNNASLYLVHRTDRLVEIINILKENNLEPKTLRFIYPKIGKNSNMFLMEAKKNANSGIVILPPLITHNEDGSYTDEVLSMFS